MEREGVPVATARMSRGISATLARKFHWFPAAGTDLTGFAALSAARVSMSLASQARSVLSSTPAHPDSRSLCGNSHFRALVSGIGEISELAGREHALGALVARFRFRS